MYMNSNGHCSQEVENEDDEDEIEEDNFDLNFSHLEPTNGETKPEFDSGRQLVEWLERRLEYTEVHLLAILIW